MQSAEKSLAELVLQAQSAVTSLATVVADIQPIGADRMIFEFLKDSGDSIEMAIDGDASPTTFLYTAPAGGVAIERVNFQVVDGTFEDPEGFFALAALTTGLTIQLVRAAAVLQHFGTDVAPIKRHNQFANLAGTDADASTSAANVSRYSVRWTVSRAGNPLRMEEGDTLEIVVADDIAALTEFRAMVQGVLL